MPNLDSKARRVARKAGLIACKSRRQESSDNLGGYMLVDPAANAVVAGPNFDMTAIEVIDHCAVAD